MDLLAFSLLGFGTLLVLVGVIYSLVENKKQAVNWKGNFQGAALASANLTEARPLAGQAERMAAVQFPAAEPARPRVQVHVSAQNPLLFEKKAYLYLDHSAKNNYGGQGEFRLQDMAEISRFGQGVFSYDGFIFRFSHSSGEQTFPLESLNHIAFYPNCIVLVPQMEKSVALLFVDESESLRKALETFKLDNGA